jgi:hypothetical protein
MNQSSYYWAYPQSMKSYLYATSILAKGITRLDILTSGDLLMSGNPLANSKSGLYYSAY